MFIFPRGLQQTEVVEYMRLHSAFEGNARPRPRPPLAMPWLDVGTQRQSSVVRDRRDPSAERGADGLLTF